MNEITTSKIPAMVSEFKKICMGLGYGITDEEVHKFRIRLVEMTVLNKYDGWTLGTPEQVDNNVTNPPVSLEQDLGKNTLSSRFGIKSSEIFRLTLGTSEGVWINDDISAGVWFHLPADLRLKLAARYPDGITEGIRQALTEYFDEHRHTVSGQGLGRRFRGDWASSLGQAPEGYPGGRGHGGS